MISVEEASARLLQKVALAPSEQVSISDALGRVLAEPLQARRTQPPFAVSAMDGYAVRAEDTTAAQATLEIVAEIAAGTRFDGKIGPGKAARIFTGAPIPNGADAILIQEDAERAKNQVHVKEPVKAGTYIRPAGLDFSEGDILFQPGKRLTARDIGLIAAMNIPWLHVARKPRVAILSTGDEVVMPGDPIGPNQIVSSNGLSLAAIVKAAGGDPVLLGVAPDRGEDLKKMAAGAKGSDILVTTGGASVGEHDLVQSALGDAGLEIDFWRIAMRPGKPLMVGKFHDALMLGLPGNPVSTVVCALLFLIPALHHMLGQTTPEPGLSYVSAKLTEPLSENDRRQDYLRSTLTLSDTGERLVTPFMKQDSSMMRLLQMSDCLIERPPHAAPLEAGSMVKCLELPTGILSV